MAEIDGGALSFKSVMDNDQMNAAIDETLRRVQGLSDGTVAGGQKMDAAFDNTADGIRDALGQIGAACAMHEQALQSLETEYQRLGQQAGAAFMAGRDEEYQAITQQQAAIKGEMTVREHLIRDLQEQSNRLEDTASKMEENKRKVEENANAHVSMRTRIKEVREEMMLLVDQGIDEQSEAYQRLKNELGRLIDIQGDVAQQGKILANDEQKYQGIIQGLSGLAGGFSAVTGTVSLFAGENEDLQKVMTKVQSVMAITIGLQQVAQTLNKDSAFMLVTVRKAKELLTIAEGKFAVALGISNVAAKALMATLTLGLSVAIGAAIYLWDKFNTKSKEAKKAAEEFSKSLIEGCYKPIGTIEMLSTKYAQLGDDMAAKKKFIQENKKAFDELGVSVKDVADAQNLLIDNKDTFIAAQIAKAKAMVYTQKAMEETKDLVEAQQKLESTPRTKLQTGGEYTDGYGVKRKTRATIEVINPDWTAANAKFKEAQGKVNAFLNKAANAEKEAFQELKKIGQDYQDGITKGTIAWYEKQIADKQAHLKTLSVLNDAEINATKKEIADYQKIIDDATGKKITGGSSNSKKDPFLENLEKHKNEYTRFMKWINSGDEIIAKSANAEFAGLLKEGATYIDYLKKQRDELIAKIGDGNATNQQTKELQALNNAISDETKISVIDAFNTKLSEQLDSANSVIEKLQIIADMRNDLKGDGTDVDNTKKETLDNSEKEVVKQAQDEYKVAMQEHSDYLDSKIKADIQYINKRKELENQLKDTKDPKQREVIQTQIKTLDIKHDTQNAIDYDSMLAEFQSYQQKRQSISDDFDKKIALATEKKNDDLVKRLEEAKANAMSELDMNELMDSDTWNQLFGNLDNLTASKMIELRNKVESEWAKLKLSPEQLEALRNKMGEVTTKIEENNPFLALADAIKRYKAGEKDVDFKDIAKSASASIDLIKGSFDAVVGGMEKMGIQMDEETQAIIGDIGGILDGASQLASGIATGNPLAIIQGGIGLLSSAFDLFNFRDRKAEKSIKKHKENIEALEKAYNQLEWAIDKALGGAVYKNQQAAINNMKQQQQELRGMIRDEDSKKKTDHGKINEWSEQIAELDRQIQDMVDEISKDILQTDAKTFANELGDALMEAFSKGEDAAKAFDDVVNNVLKNAIVNQLKKNFLETQLNTELEKLKDSMGYWNGDEFIFDGLTDAEIANFKNKVAAITSNFNQALGIYSDLFKDLELDKEDDTSLTGAVKGVSEETASIVAGQMNAIRINQMEATAILRQQLAALATIANNTSYNFHLAKLERIVTLLENSQSSSSLRSQGLL